MSLRCAVCCGISISALGDAKHETVPNLTEAGNGSLIIQTLSRHFPDTFQTLSSAVVKLHTFTLRIGCESSRILANQLRFVGNATSASPCIICAPANRTRIANTGDRCARDGPRIARDELLKYSAPRAAPAVARPRARPGCQRRMTPCRGTLRDAPLTASRDFARRPPALGDVAS
eukprot:7115794-Prymnesium_polylepis.1